jgi:hypothetical protein
MKKQIIERITVYVDIRNNALIKSKAEKFYNDGYRCVYKNLTQRKFKIGKNVKMIFEKEIN